MEYLKFKKVRSSRYIILSASVIMNSIEFLGVVGRRAVDGKVGNVPSPKDTTEFFEG